MAISSVGIGSGLDVESIVTQMIALEKQPIKTLEAKATVIESKISAYGEIKSLADTLNAAVRDLTLDRTWNTVKINSSSTTVANASMTGSAAAGSYNVEVSRLAQSQTSVSAKFTSTATMGTAGVVRVAIGDPSNSAGTVKTFDLNVSATDTLQSLADKVNADPNISKTVIASVITDSSGQQQLMVRARETGQANQFSFSFGASFATQADVDADPALTLGDVMPAVSGGLATLAGVDGFKQTQAALNAEIKLNGVTLESNSNSFTDTIPGLSISVSAVGSSLLTVTQDKDAIQASIQKFVDSYNAINDLLTSSTKYTEESKQAGLLQGDSSTVSLQNALRMLTQGIAGNATGVFNRLSDAGISMQQGGKLTVDNTKMATALNSMDALKSMFAAKADVLGNGGGIAVNFKSFTDELLAYEGTLNSKTDSLENQLKLNKGEVTKVETRAETVEARLRKQYSALDVKMASLSSLSSYVEQMVTTWNKSKD